MDYELEKISSVELLGEFQDEYVYDIIMEDSSTPWFFANDILVHNSCYFKCIGATDEDSAIRIADTAAESVNSTFPHFMKTAFLCQPAYQNFIKAGREIVGRRGLFQAKKKYMIKVINLDGYPVDKLKTMGSEIKKSDTPKIIRSFLKTTVDMILSGESYDDVCDFVIKQRREIMKNPNNVFKLGVAKQVNNMNKYIGEYAKPGSSIGPTGRKLTIPGHARAAFNYNSLLQTFDPGAKPISTGDKVLVYSVKQNDYNFDTIAIPSDLTSFPKWIEDHFQLNLKKTEQSMFDAKLGGVFSAIGKDTPSVQSVLNNKILKF
jgi:hypothetical protein